MSTPLGRQNLSGALLDNVYEVGLSALAANLGNDVSLTGSDVSIDGPKSLLICTTLASGALTIKVDEFAVGASHSFGSPSADVTISNTQATYIKVDLANTAFGIKLTAGASGCEISSLAVMVLNQLKVGENWIDVQSAQNSTVTVNDDSGVVDFGLLTEKRFLA